MALFGFGQKPRPMGFDYTPLYYNPEKEEREARYGAARSSGIEGVKLRIKSGFKSKSGGSRTSYRVQTRQSNIRFIIILALLVAVFFYFLSSDGFLSFLESMSNTK